MKLLLAITLFTFGLTVVAAEPRYMPKNGYVPDQATAVKIAEAVLVPIYGEQVLKQRPFKATLSGDRWTVEGYLPPDWLGGVAHIEIKKSTGEILYVMHGK